MQIRFISRKNGIYSMKTASYVVLFFLVGHVTVSHVTVTAKRSEDRFRSQKTVFSCNTTSIGLA